MLKQGLRQKYSALRKDISSTTLLYSSLRVTKHVLQLPIWSFQHYHIFMPITEKKELHTAYLRYILLQRDKEVIVPKVTAKDTLLQNCLISEKTKFRRSKWGIPEPVNCTELPVEQIDVVFLPLLVFDTQGNRVGYGKGFYDTFLRQCRPDVVKVGLCLFGPEKEITDIHNNDVALDYGVTPKRVYMFSAS
ncbi:MAG: 5-formyltetrahydrofolate cyclo-ligase [Bacteroidota bacterium]